MCVETEYFCKSVKSIPKLKAMNYSKIAGDKIRRRENLKINNILKKETIYRGTLLTITDE